MKSSDLEKEEPVAPTGPRSRDSAFAFTIKKKKKLKSNSKCTRFGWPCGRAHFPPDLFSKIKHIAEEKASRISD